MNLKLIFLLLINICYIFCMQNLYKQNGIFICKHDTHKHFSSQMSVYHVLEQKKCFPDGCVYFKWNCKILAKKKKCHRNFKTVGRKCFSCNHFYEEKIHQYPEITLDENEKIEFYDKYKEFKEWLESNENKIVFCEGKISRILPNFTINRTQGELSFGVQGFLVSFKDGFIEDKLIEDSFYLHIDTFQQNKYKLREDDEIEFKAKLKIIDGRLELYYARYFNFYLRGSSKPMLKSDLLVALNTATSFNVQYDKCKKCNLSINPRIQNNKIGKNRMMICTKGIPDPEYCLENVEREYIHDIECENDKADGISCNRTL